MRALMKLVLLAGLVALGLYVYQGLQGPREAEDQVARKPAAIRVAVQRALQRCDLQASYPQKLDYENRIAGILKHAYTSALEEVNERNIAICLDQRLGRQDTKLLDQIIMGVYYPDVRIVTLMDDGAPSQFNNWFASYSWRRVSSVIDALSLVIGDSSFGATGPMFASVEDRQPPRTIWQDASKHSKAQVTEYQTPPLGR